MDTLTFWRTKAKLGVGGVRPEPFDVGPVVDVTSLDLGYN
jgi:hypothetical protein